jgi:uncharacterized FlgJ-related protein
MTVKTETKAVFLSDGKLSIRVYIPDLRLTPFNNPPLFINHLQKIFPSLSVKIISAIIESEFQKLRRNFRHIKLELNDKQLEITATVNILNTDIETVKNIEEKLKTFWKDLFKILNSLNSKIEKRREELKKVYPQMFEETKQT